MTVDYGIKMQLRVCARAIVGPNVGARWSFKGREVGAEHDVVHGQRWALCGC